jgi:hypothetical protein
MTKAQMTAAAEAPAQEQQVVVFTAWEETRTVRQIPRSVADYGTSESGNEQLGAATGQASSEPAMRITVTRLIFAIYPASAAPATPGAIQRAQRAPSTHPSRPPTPPVDNGWLIFEL